MDWFVREKLTGKPHGLHVKIHGVRFRFSRLNQSIDDGSYELWGMIFRPSSDNIILWLYQMMLKMIQLWYGRFTATVSSWWSMICMGCSTLLSLLDSRNKSIHRYMKDPWRACRKTSHLMPLGHQIGATNIQLWAYNEAPGVSNGPSSSTYWVIHRIFATYAIRYRRRRERHPELRRLLLQAPNNEDILSRSSPHWMTGHVAHQKPPLTAISEAEMTQGLHRPKYTRLAQVKQMGVSEN